LIDIGCSGGISPSWRRFEPTLQAIGIDPVASECKRLTDIEKNAKISYLSAYVGLPETHPFRIEREKQSTYSTNPWNRLSAKAAAGILRDKTASNEVLPVLNEWQSEVDSKEPPLMGVNDVAAQAGFTNVDFIKIDIDGNDLEALISAKETIETSPVLGLALEVNYYGTPHPTDHTFHNTDRMMREWGFELFDLTVRRYSASALPQQFQWAMPAQTTRGRPYQGDAIYLRDPCAWEYAPSSRVELSPQKLFKLACLFELFGLPDHAAELLRDHEGALSETVKVEELLHLLANQADPTIKSYQEYLHRFQTDPKSFYPSS